jgi:hypothetical protein
MADTFALVSLLFLFPAPTCCSEAFFKLTPDYLELLGGIPMVARDEPPVTRLGAPDIGLLGGFLCTILVGTEVKFLDDILCFERLLAVVGPPFLTEFHLAISSFTIGSSSILTPNAVPLLISFLLKTSVRVLLAS